MWIYWYMCFLICEFYFPDFSKSAEYRAMFIKVLESLIESIYQRFVLFKLLDLKKVDF